MYLERKQDLSVLYFLKDMFSNTEYINVVDAFPLGELVLPTVSLEWDTIDTAEYQLGDYHRVQMRVWFIDIFGKNKSQRDEIAYKIINELETGVPVYNYDEGFPEDNLPSVIGKLLPDIIRAKNIKVIPELVQTLYWRSTVTFTANYEQVTS